MSESDRDYLNLLFRGILLAVCFIAVPLYLWSAASELTRISEQDVFGGERIGSAFAFLSGALVAWLLYLLWPPVVGDRTRIDKLRLVIGLHEKSHKLAGRLLGARIFEELTSVEQGGHVKYDYPYRNGVELIALAPYYLQPVPLVLIAVKAIALPEFHAVLSAAIGLAWFSFYCDAWWTLTVGAGANDIADAGGTWCSGVIIVAANVVVTGLVLTAVGEATSAQRFLYSGVPTQLLNMLTGSIW